MNHNLNFSHACLYGIFTFTVIGIGSQGYGKNNDENAWPNMRQLGQDIPTNRGKGAPETEATHVQSCQEPEGILTLRRALELALIHSPELIGSAYGVRASEGKAQQAGTILNPSLELTAEEFGGSGARNGYDAAQTTALLSQTIELGGKRSKRREVAQTEARLAGWDYETKRLDILILTKKAYVDVLLAQGQLALAESLLVVADDVRLAAAKRVQAGKVPPLEEVKAGVEVASARIARDRAKRELDTARKRLSASWGGTMPVFREAGGDLDSIRDVPPVETFAALLDNTPEVARWDDEVALSRRSLSVAKSERIPNVSINAGISRFEEDGSHAYTAGLSLPLPLFNRNTGGVLAAKHHATRAEYEQQAARLRAATGLVEAHNRLAMARAEAVATKDELLPGAQQAFDSAKKGYQVGKFGYLEVLDTQRTLSEAKSHYLEVLAAYHKAVADVERLTGNTLNPIQ